MATPTPSDVKDPPAEERTEISIDGPDIDFSVDGITTLAANWWEKIHTTVTEQVLVPTSLIQLGVIAFALILAYLFSKPTRRRIALTFGEKSPRLARLMISLTLPGLWLVFQWVMLFVAGSQNWPVYLIRLVLSLLTAWVGIRVALSFIRDPGWAKLISSLAWTVAAINIVGLLPETLSLLDRLAVNIGTFRLSVLLVIKSIASLALLVWLAIQISKLFERKISNVSSITPSARVLFTKLLKVMLLALAVIIGLQMVGLDLTTLAVFGGAIGVGIGFGLQKVVANLISGIILLLDKSVKPGDVIVVGDTYGWISSLGARYVSVVTRDGTEHLIPNETLITERVENWSFSNNLSRQKADVGVSYNANLKEVQQLCIQAARETQRVLDTPAPVCLLSGFGDSSVDFQIRFWINDAQNGLANVRSDVLMNVWLKFKEHNIEIPFPQRDLHLKDGATIQVTMPETKMESAA